MEDTNNTFFKSRKLKIALATGAMLTSLLGCGVPAWGNAPATTQPEMGDAMAPAASSGSGVVTKGLDSADKISLEPSKSRKVYTGRKVTKVHVLNPDIADFIILDPTTVLVTAKKAGMTQLIITDDADHAQVLDVEVQSDVARLNAQLKEIFPNDKIDVTEVNGSLSLRGHVANLNEADQVMQVAAPYSPQSKVLNFLEISGGQQVMLQVRFAEVSKTAATNLGVNFGFSDGTSFFGNNVGQVNPFGTSAGTGLLQQLAPSAPGAAVSVFGQGQLGKEAFQYFISALRTNNLLRMLAEPDLVTTSGQAADFLAGGEFPIPVTQGGGSGGGTSVTVEYKDFGVKLNFVPTVEGDGHIRIKVGPEVSELDFSTAVKLNGFVVPGLTTRRVNTTVELTEGQTFAIAGLLSSDYSANTSVLPVLGDVPVLGALFRSVQYQRKETELVVLVTPYLVKPMDPSEVGKMPGEQWRYPTESDLFFKKDLGGDMTDTAHAPALKGPAPKFHGQYGFRPPETTMTPSTTPTK